MVWEIHQIDVNTTFIIGVLEVEIYMDQLEGFVQEGKPCVQTQMKIVRTQAIADVVVSPC